MDAKSNEVKVEEADAFIAALGLMDLGGGAALASTSEDQEEAGGADATARGAEAQGAGAGDMEEGV